MPSHFLSLFKPRSRSRSPASQSESSIRNSSSSAALTINASANNTSSTIDRATIAVVSESQSERSIFIPRVSASPARSVAVNGLKFALRQLGKAPVPGIELATSSLLDVINRIENMAVVDKECKKLTKRMESLWYLASNISEIDASGRLMGPLIEELQKLAGDLEVASRQNKLEAFFNSDDDLSSLDSHTEALNNIIADLTAALATATRRDTIEIRKQIGEAVTRLHMQANGTSGNYTSSGLITHMSGNKFARIERNFAANNKVHGENAKMIHDIRRNDIGFIGGDAFSGNTVSVFAP